MSPAALAVLVAAAMTIDTAIAFTYGYFLGARRARK